MKEEKFFTVKLNKVNMAQNLNASEFIKTEIDSAIENNYTILPESFDSIGNLTLVPTRNELPQDMKFNDGHQLAVIVCPILMILSAIGNVTVFAVIVRLRMKGKLSRINLFLLHLSIADLIVTFLMMPLEIGWNATVSWDAGDFVCRFMSFFRIFGLYLSSFMLVCISLDRYFAVLKPLGIVDANSRGKIMLTFAWVASIACSLPQSYLFHVEKHPKFRWYEQCVTFNSFPSPEAELVYNFFGFFFLYGFPLVMITFCYTRILLEIYRINRQERNGQLLRRSNIGALARAKTKTLKMTVIIVATFFLCWTPYNVMSFWYWFDKKSAQEVDPRVQKALFMFACANSCVNPLVYGLFHFRRNKNSVSNTGTAPISHRGESNSFKSRVLRKFQCCRIWQRRDSSTMTELETQPQFGNLRHCGSSNVTALQTTRRDGTLTVCQAQRASPLSSLSQFRNCSPNQLAPCQPSSSFQTVEWDGNAARIVINAGIGTGINNTVSKTTQV